MTYRSDMEGAIANALVEMTDYARVAIRPPILFLAALALGCLLSLTLPAGPSLGSATRDALIAGLTFAVIGFALAAYSVRALRHAGTHIVPGKPATALVTTGPYAITRNPIYIGFVLVYFGLSILLTSIWVLIMLAPVLIILQRGVVEREEAYLERTFGGAYRKYKKRVPRWL